MRSCILPLLSLLQLTLADSASDVASGVCKPITLIFARGTGESGNLGTVVGPPLLSALESALGSDQVAGQGVEYAADVSGAVTGAADPKAAAGSLNMASFAETVATNCPSGKVILAGYSQGAEQVRGALMNLASSNNVLAAITFGDPLSSQAFSNIAASNTKVNCASGDLVCSGQFVITAAHLSYGSNGDVEESVQFVQGLMGSATAAVAQSVKAVAIDVAETKRAIEFSA